MLADSPVIALLPSAARPLWPCVDWTVTYFFIVVASLFWVEMSRGGLRRLLQAVAILGLAIGLAGVATRLAGGPADRFLLPNHILAIPMMLAVAVVSVTPALARRYLTLHTPALTVGVLVAIAAALYTNLGGLLSYEPAPIEPLAFAFFFACLGYVTARHVLRKERQLLSIEKELEIAREIQRSILPASVPAMSGLRIGVEYHPMTAVAGDFYEFLPVDDERAGFFIADVSGHGVPAALVASLVKAAVLSLSTRAETPATLLGDLNERFTHSLRSQLVTAAYLYVDLAAPRAFYSAAGHPPLLYWDSTSRDLRTIESNGLLLGVANKTDYPVRELPLRAGDRFILYTDGLSEAENAAGETFGARRLGDGVRAHRDAPAPELGVRMLDELRRWRPPAAAQQDDVTWIVVDVL
jgi:phosphoserine phosphatase RsbU/P